MYEIEFTAEALLDLKSLRKAECQEIIAGIEAHLSYEPTVETCNRKPLRPNEIAN